MNKLVLEIGFIELLVAVFGSALMGVLLMVLYHRLAMRREREQMQRRVDDLARAIRPAEVVVPIPVPPVVPVVTQTRPTAPAAPEPGMAGAIIPESTDSLDFHSPKSGG